MIPFRRIDIEDKSIVQKYTLSSNRRNCDLTFANLYSWRFLYLTEIAEYEGFLLFRFYLEGEVVYMLPVGNGNLKLVIEKLMADAKSKNTPFRMLGVCEESCEELEQLFPGMFVFTLERDYSDYLYLRSDLAELRGKKFQPKRNHINKFKSAYPDYQFKPLTRELIKECMQLESQWCRANNCNENEDLQNERKSMSSALKYFDELDILGGVLMVGETIVGFTYGAPVNNVTFDTCVEKANTEYDGVYAVLNNEFANYIPEQYTYINREEDLGIEGLRKAKLSYQPYHILNKYRMEVKKDQIKDLWKKSFPEDSGEFVDLYFEKRYSEDVDSCIIRDGKVVSALQRIPYPMQYMGTVINTSYISGACTHPDYRSMGLMRELLADAHRKMYDDGVQLATLIPAGHSLKSYYRKSGYMECFQQAVELLTINSLPVDKYSNALEIRGIDMCITPLKEIAEFYNQQLSTGVESILHTETDLSVILADHKLSGGEVWVGYAADSSLAALAFTIKSDEKLIIKEMVCKDDCCGKNDNKSGYCNSLIRFLLDHYKVLSAELVQPVKSCVSQSSEDNAIIDLGMARVINAQSLLEIYSSSQITDLLLEISGDDAIEVNNGYYLLSQGRCNKIDEAEISAFCSGLSVKRMDINELCTFLMKDAKPYMNMMLN